MIAPQQEILDELNELTKKMYGGELDVYFEDLEYKFDKVISMISTVHETTVSLSDTYGDLATVQTNQIVSALTIYTVVIGLMTLLTGFYGMNVMLPGQEHQWMVRIIIMMIVAVGG